MDAPQSALNKKVRCPICSEVFIAALPKAEIIEDDEAQVVKDEGKVAKEDKAVKDENKVAEEAPVKDTAGGDLPITLSAEHEPTPSAASKKPDPSDPLGQLASAGLKPGRRRKTATKGSQRATDARKALASFAATPEPQVHWPGARPGPAPRRGRPKPAARYRRVSKDVWYVIAGDYEYGPYKPQVILSAIRSGNISRGILLRHALTDSVITAGRILELLPQQLKPATPPQRGKPAKGKGKKPSAARSSADDAAGSALDSMAKRPSKARPRGKRKKKQSPEG